MTDVRVFSKFWSGYKIHLQAQRPWENGNYNLSEFHLLGKKDKRLNTFVCYILIAYLGFLISDGIVVYKCVIVT